MAPHDLGIWPPHEVFYLEAMLFSTTAALKAASEVREALEVGSELEGGSPAWQDCALIILDGVQVIATQAATLSRYFWPARAKDPHKSRAVRLKSGLDIGDESPLRNRDLRNHLEHFDERLDEFCGSLVAGRILPTHVGPSGPEPEIPTYLFRAYYTDIAVLEVLGHRYEIDPLLREIESLDRRLRHAARSGGRIPYPPGA